MRREPVGKRPYTIQVWAVRTVPVPVRPITWPFAAFSFLIRGFTFWRGGHYSHLLLRLGERTWESLAHGWDEYDIHSYSDPCFVVDAWDVPLGGAALDRCVARCEALCGTPYDYWGTFLLDALVGVGVPASWLSGLDDPRKQNCSSAVAAVLLPDFPEITRGRPVWNVTPDDVRRFGFPFRGRVTWPKLRVIP